MENLLIPNTENSPSFEFYTNGKLKIKGLSIAENPMELYETAINWLANFKKMKPEKVDLHVNLDYYNTYSSKYIYKIIKEVEDMKMAGVNANIYWHHKKSDDSMAYAGQDFEFVFKLPFHFVNAES